MKKPVLILLVLSVGFIIDAEAKNIVVGTQKASEFVDCEVSTNIAFNTTRQDVRTLNVRLQADGSSASSVQIAFGRDNDGNGDLDPEETVFVVGRRGTRYFVEDVVSGIRYVDRDNESLKCGCFLQVSITTDLHFTPRAVSFESEYGACFQDLNAQPWMYRTDWNLVKITRRGAVSASEGCDIESRYRAMLILLR